MRFSFCGLLVALSSAATGFGAEVAEVDSFDAGGVRISYSTRGNGPPVVLIHGWLASTTLNWDLPGVSGDLAKEFRVIAMDVRGHGRSGKPTKESEYGLELVEDVARLLDHLKIDKAHIAGYSMGGIIAAKFAAKHPERCRSVALCGMGWLEPGGVGQRFFEQIAKNDARPGPRFLCGRSLAKLTLTKEELTAIKFPVTVIVGDKDPCFRLYVKPLQAIRKDWPVVEVKGVDHLSCIVDPYFKEELHQWLAKQTSTPKPPSRQDEKRSPSAKEKNPK